MLWHENAILTQSWLNRGLSCARHLCFKFLCQSFVGFATINFKTMWPFVLQLYRALVGRARERGKRGKCGFNLKLPPFVSNEHPSLPPPLTHGMHVILRSTLGGFLIWRPQRFGIFPLPTLYPLNLYCTVCTQMRTPLPLLCGCHIWKLPYTIHLPHHYKHSRGKNRGTSCSLTDWPGKLPL